MARVHQITRMNCTNKFIHVGEIHRRAAGVAGRCIPSARKTQFEARLELKLHCSPRDATIELNDGSYRQPAKRVVVLLAMSNTFAQTA
jgi:hypothetical protein